MLCACDSTESTTKTEDESAESIDSYGSFNELEIATDESKENAEADSMIENETIACSEIVNEQEKTDGEFEYSPELQEYLCFEQMTYNSSFTNFIEDVELEQVELKMELVQETEAGKIYSIRIDNDLQFEGRYEWGMDLFNLGYFLFTKDEILYVEQLYNGEIPTVDDFLSLGYVVLSTVDEEISYCKYSDGSVEFYHMDDSADEYFTFMKWEKGKGLTVFQNGHRSANWSITLDK